MALKRGVKAIGLSGLSNEMLSGHYTNLEKENGPPNTEVQINMTRKDPLHNIL